jgi:hypothetical protein
MVRRCARTATMDIIRMHARLTGTTVLAGSMAGCSSEQVRGSAAGLDSGRDSDLAAGLDSVDDLGSADGQDLEAGRESGYVDQLAVVSTGMFHVVVTSTAADHVAAAVSMAEVVRAAEAVHMVAATAADTGKIQQ